MECDICVEKIENDDFFECDGCVKKLHIKCDKMNKKDINARKASERIRLMCSRCIKKPNKLINENINTMLKFVQKIDLTTQTYDAKQTQMVYDMERMKDKIEELFKSMGELEKEKLNTKTSYAATVKNLPKIPIVVKPKEKTQNSDITKEDIRKSVNLKDVKANGLHKIKEGGIVINCASNAESMKISQLVQSKIGDKYEVELPEIKKPRLKIVNSFEKMTNDEIIMNLKNQNDLPQTAEIKIITQIKKKLNEASNVEKYDIVIEADKDTHDTMMNKQSVNLGWTRCKVYKHTHLIRCYNCCGYAHIAKDCKNKRACSKCGDEHKRSECTNDNKKCVNCKVICEKFKLNLNTNHEAFDKNCEIFRKKSAQILNKFGYKDNP